MPRGATQRTYKKYSSAALSGSRRPRRRKGLWPFALAPWLVAVGVSLLVAGVIYSACNSSERSTHRIIGIVRFVDLYGS